MRTLLMLTLIVGAFAGCLSDAPASDLSLDTQELPTGSHPTFGFTTYLSETNPWGMPEARPLPEVLTGLTEVAHVDGTRTAGGIMVFGPYAYLGGRTSGPLHIVDIQDPTSPKLIAEVADVPVRDADMIAFPPTEEDPDGRLVLITTAGGRNMFATDVTNPETAALIGEFETEHGNHNIAVVPGTPIVYNSGGSGMIDIVDWSTPEEPVQLGTFENGNGCHDISFFVSEEKQRAYCAGYAQSEIWDIADPTAPVMIKEIPYPRGPHGSAMPLSFSHLAIVNHDASVLIVGDETGGGAINGCDFYTGMGGDLNSGPYGNLWFYDLADETNPVLKGHVSPNAFDADGSCTAHFGKTVEDTNHVVMGFYNAGVLLVDFTDLDAPKIVDRLDQGGSIWDAMVYQGYVFTGDMSRGMDVLTFE